MYSFIHWISCWFSSLFTYIFGTIQRLLSVQGKTCIEKDIESGRDVSAEKGVSLKCCLACQISN